VVTTTPTDRGAILSKPTVIATLREVLLVSLVPIRLLLNEIRQSHILDVDRNAHASVLNRLRQFHRHSRTQFRRSLLSC
jgi:hypothetical protein